jgi:hypothetical protein
MQNLTTIHRITIEPIVIRRYCSRNAHIGPTWVARRAGTYVASIAATRTANG